MLSSKHFPSHIPKKRMGFWVQLSGKRETTLVDGTEMRHGMLELEKYGRIQKYLLSRDIKYGRARLCYGLKDEGVLPEKERYHD